MKAAELVRISEVTKSFRRGSEVVHALMGVSLSLARGELVALVGRSGSGKTTLLNVLAGWEQPDAGDVSWCDGHAAPVWERVAIVPQALGLVDELTIGQNVELPLRLSGSAAEDGALEALLADLGLAELTDRYPLQTSLGQQQRCAVARALVVSPALLLADEPTGHQDARWGAAVFRSLRAASERGSCCLVATHSPAIGDHAHRIVAVVDGSVTPTPAD